MSKIFDALKKVQAEVGQVEQKPEGQVDPVGAEVASLLDVPEAFVTEIVSMRYSLESKLSRAHRSLLFTCSVQGEGVSMVSRVFSQILVQDPVSKVALIDANTHNPSVHTAFGLDKGPGLTDLLTGRNSLEECLRRTESPRLNVMTAGESMVAPMQAFASQQMKKMIADIVATHNYLVFDSPPTLQSAETTVLSSQVDGVVFVVQAVRTKKEVVKKAVDAITKGGGEILGLVLNKNKHFIPEFIYKRV
jgi:capsular exopolysaccharide synthesis family protein